MNRHNTKLAVGEGQSIIWVGGGRGVSVTLTSYTMAAGVSAVADQLYAIFLLDDESAGQWGGNANESERGPMLEVCLRGGGKVFWPRGGWPYGQKRLTWTVVVLRMQSATHEPTETGVGGVT